MKPRLIIFFFTVGLKPINFKTKNYYYQIQFKLCRVKSIRVGPNKIPYLYTDDGRTINYPNPAIQLNDTVKIDLQTGKIIDFFPSEAGIIIIFILLFSKKKKNIGNLVYITGGNNIGRVGVY